MEGRIATWYARNTRGDNRFKSTAETISTMLPAGSRILEVAPGPGYLAIELARRGYRVTGLDISQTFVRIANENAAAEGVSAQFQVGNAAAMPFPDGSFDLVVCQAAFKNFTDPLGALNEAHRVLAPGGRAIINDLRSEASHSEIGEEVERMHLSRLSAFWTRQTFRWFLLKNAYSEPAMRELVSRSAFGAGEMRRDGIGFELTLLKPALVTA
jgi:ubiquinone/menaquinone biosynthesis C-methylase UbiE